MSHKFDDVMRRSVMLLARAASGLRPEDVHRARVALRTCRAQSATLQATDPDQTWTCVQVLSRQVFQALGRLRDVHVSKAWVEQLSLPGSPGRARLRRQLNRREAHLTPGTVDAIDTFDRRGWARLREALEPRLTRVVPDGPAAQAMVRAHLESVCAAHTALMRRPSAERWHALRVAVKQLRYAVELLCPSLHGLWSQDLRTMQRLLGAVHDLDVLESIVSADARVDPQRRALSLLPAIRAERAAKRRACRTCLQGGRLLRAWTRGLPSKAQAATTQFEVLASAVAPDLTRVTAMSEVSRQTLRALGALVDPPLSSAASLLQAATLLHGVGGVGRHPTPKETARAIRRLVPPAGWSRNRLVIVSLIVRQALRRRPARTGARLEQMTPRQRARVVTLGAVLRLSCAVCVDGAASTGTVTVRRLSGRIVVAVPDDGARRPMLAAAVHELARVFDIRTAITQLRRTRVPSA